MSGEHIEARVNVRREDAGLVESLMTAQGALAVTLTDCEDRPLWEPGVGETPLWGKVVVTGLFDPDADGQALEAVLSLAPGVNSFGGVVLTRLADRPWERAWMDQFKAMRFGQSLWIVPTGQACPDETAVNLRLDPGLAFGTGTHPTTRLCLEWIDATAFEDRVVLDYGCGSGVLGIAAALKGAKQVTCVDHDPQAVEATLENARRNGVEDQVRAHCAATPPGGVFDCVLANILAGILVRLAEPLQSAVAPQGCLALSGILDDQADEVVRAFAREFPRLHRRHDEGWTLLHGVAREVRS